MEIGREKKTISRIQGLVKKKCFYCKKKTKKEQIENEQNVIVYKVWGILLSQEWPFQSSLLIIKYLLYAGHY